jgi:hypothetical protein
MDQRGSVRAKRVEVTTESDAIAEPDYASTFEVIVPDTDVRSAEQWVRATFEDAPRALRWFVLTGWRYVLGFRLGPRASPTYVLGWKILTSTPDSIGLELRSPLVSAHKVLRVEGARVRVTTFVRYERRIGRALWLAATPIHHRTEPYLLGHAASHPPTGGQGARARAVSPVSRP